jgi:hypothetical protein
MVAAYDVGAGGSGTSGSGTGGDCGASDADSGIVRAASDRRIYQVKAADWKSNKGKMRRRNLERARGCQGVCAGAARSWLPR